MDHNMLGKRIREARGELSLRDFAEKCGLSHTHIDSLEKGYDPRTGKPVSVSVETVRKIAAAIGKPVEYLMGGPEPPEPNMQAKIAELNEILSAKNGAYLRLAQGAHEQDWDEDDVDFMLEFYKRSRQRPATGRKDKQ